MKKRCFAWSCKILSVLILSLILVSGVVSSLSAREGSRIEKEVLFSGQQKKLTLKGFVYDENKQELPGVTVLLSGTMVGNVTDVKGFFQMVLPVDTGRLEFSFIGYQKQVVSFTPKMANDTLRIWLKPDTKQLEGVVVTGMGTVNKSTFTGSATHIKREELLKVGGRSLVDILQVFDPAFRIAENNLMGSDPNTRPEYYVRGRSGIGNTELDKMNSSDVSEFALTNNPNAPIFILDGFEVSADKIFDMDVNRIQDIYLLKDASATAIYGAKASNGIVVVETVAPKPGDLEVSYSGTLEISVPDLSSYNLMNSAEKLETEWDAGLFEPWGISSITYENELNSLMWYYLQKRNLVIKGVDSYWLSQPLRTQVNHRHSDNVQGGAEEVRFGFDFYYDNENGVMKKSYRDRFGVGMTFKYDFKKLALSNNVTYDVVKGKDSPYGIFSEYANKQPYDYWLDDNGELVKTTTQWGNYGGSTTNPLYEAVISNFAKDSYTELADNFALKWRPIQSILIDASMKIAYKQEKKSDFKDPASGDYSYQSDRFERGELSNTETNTFTFNSKVYGSLAISDKAERHMLNTRLGWEMELKKSKYMSSQYQGFPDAERNNPAYAYDIVKKPTFTDNHVRNVGFFGTLNYSYLNRYFVDASFRLDASSEFGSSSRWGSFWSAGLGVNLHKFDFLEGTSVREWKLVANIGETGKMNFAPYVARNIYKVNLESWYPSGIGATFDYMGNEDLKWERQLSWNIRSELIMFNGIMQLDVDVYNKLTKDMITSVSLPSSSGFTSYTDNIGEVENKGFEVALNLRLLQRGEWTIFGRANLGHNVGRLKKISNSLKEYNDRVDEYYEDYKAYDDKYYALLFNANSMQYATPIMKYEEGSSLTAIYGMKSLGINPANGREVFVRRDGTITYDWNSAEQQKIGDTEPWGTGSFSLNAQYGNWSLYTTFMFEFGGDAYNTTLVNQVENVNLSKYNADKRVMTERWHEVGDVSPLKSVADRYGVTRSTSRFVQKNNFLKMNSLTLDYSFNRELVNRLGLNVLKLGFNMQDLFRISTIKQERGTSYPFANTFRFNLTAIF